MPNDQEDQESVFQSLDHIAIVVQDTEEALLFYRDMLGLPVLLSEVLEEQGVRLTHLDLGNAHLQLVQPLKDDHPLSEHLRKHGEGLHHLCLRVDSVPAAIQALPERGLRSRDAQPRRGPKGKISDALVEVVRGLDVPPRYLVAKGGVTSSEVATRGLGVRRAMVRGQVLPGVPVWQLGAETRFPGLP